jgi:hypothetical protein
MCQKFRKLFFLFRYFNSFYYIRRKYVTDYQKLVKTG